MEDSVQSREQRALFDIIDKLRSQGISRYVDLPEIIVCGDQSSGKSSVLEAISGMSFPTKDNLCTRFATELILRRTPGSSSCSVSIIPDAERPENEKRELKSFDKTIDVEDLNLGKAVEEAKIAMGLSDAKRFSNDILRVELCGPDQPHLTMVDLPGLFSASDKDQSEADSKTVKRMVIRHMKRDRSIILAVISAKNDFANQQVTALTRKIDPQGTRTMGLITKPDTLHKGSESEAFYINLARNQNVKFRLGWHILRNRDYPERSSTSEERDAIEQQFFEEGAYSALERSQLGVVTLRPRLSGVLLAQILFQLPQLQADVEAGIRDCEGHLDRMGSSRSSLIEQKRYLFGVSDGFTKLMEHAVQGTYGDAFFVDAMKDDGEARRLRSVVHNRLSKFETTMKKDGRTRRIIDTDEEVEDWTAISRKDYIEEVNELMSRSHGKELPGTFNPLIIGALFAKQCTKWKSFAFKCLEDILDATEEMIDDILEMVAAPQTRFAIRGTIVTGMEAIKLDLKQKTNQILENHVNGHPITFSRQLIDEVQKVQAERRAKHLESAMIETFGQDWETERHVHLSSTLIDMVRNLTDANMENYASSLAVDYTEAYFKVASQRFVDNLADLSVERCLMSKAPGLFSRSIIDELDDEEIHAIASESPEAAESRARYTGKLDVLRAGLEDLKKLSRHRTKGFRAPAIMDHEYQHDSVESDSDSEPEADSIADVESVASADGIESEQGSFDRPNERQLSPQPLRMTRKDQRRLKKGLQPTRHFEEPYRPTIANGSQSPLSVDYHSDY